MTKTVKIENVNELVVGDKLVRKDKGSENEYNWWTNDKEYEVEENDTGLFIQSNDDDKYYLERRGWLIVECFEKVVTGFTLNELKHGGFLKCINNNGATSQYFSVGELYEIEEESSGQFLILDNDGDEWRIEEDFSDSAYKHFEHVAKIIVPEPQAGHIEEDVANQSHYKNQGIEPIDYMKTNFTQDEYRGFLMGNIHKYMARHKDKNGLEDLKKAQVYLGWLIKNWEGKN